MKLYNSGFLTALFLAWPDMSTVAADPNAGDIELGLGHLCDQKGCVEHVRKSLGLIKSVKAIHPLPGGKEPRATIDLREGHAIDLWGLRQSLRTQSIEITKLLPGKENRYSLIVELPRWLEDQEVKTCALCRDRLADTLSKLTWAGKMDLVEGRYHISPGRPDLDWIKLLDELSRNHIAPTAIWMVPAQVTDPLAAPPKVIQKRIGPKGGGSESHAVIDFELTHSCEIGGDLLSLLEQKDWVSRTSNEGNTIRASIGDKKTAPLTPLLQSLRAAGQVPKQIRFRDFGNTRVEFKFAHICGEVEYSKPKKSKKEDPKKKGDKKEADKEKKPFVPKPLRPAKTSNGRIAIEAALSDVEGMMNVRFLPHLTKPMFSSVRNVFMSFETNREEDVFMIDPLVEALRKAGFPPQSVTVSRRFPGIPFGKPLPGELQLTDQKGELRSLDSMKKGGRPLAFAFVSLNYPKKKEYKPDVKFFEQLKNTINAYQGKVDFVAVSANKADTFTDVVEFWKKTGISVPLFNDADASVRAVFNSMVTPAPHLFVFDEEGFFRYAGEPHNDWGKDTKKKIDYLADTLELVLTGNSYEKNHAAFYNKPLCNCSHPQCSCPKCGCGATCRCGSKRCGVGFGTNK